MTDSVISIKDVARAAGLSTSVLRVWESRYGWPSPRRDRNGYRAFTKPQMEEVLRAVRLIRAGTPIGQIVVDGFPKWPDAPLRDPVRPRLGQARALAAPVDRSALELRDQLLDALQAGDGVRAEGVLQRACRELRPADEVRAVLAPALVALAELAAAGRPLPAGDGLAAWIGQRCANLRRQFRAAPDAPRWAVAAATPAHGPLAELAAVVLAKRGCAVERSDGKADAGVRRLLVGGTALDGGLRGSALPEAGAIPVAEWFADGFPPAD